MSPARYQEYFADGLTEELLSLLSQIDNLKVAARTSSFSFKGKDLDVSTIGERLGVATVLEGVGSSGPGDDAVGQDRRSSTVAERGCRGLQPLPPGQAPCPAPAWVALAYARSNQVEAGYVSHREGLEGALAAIHRALELGENLAEAWAVLGEIKMELEWNGQERTRPSGEPACSNHRIPTSYGARRSSRELSGDCTRLSTWPAMPLPSATFIDSH
jgi:hypothetical protein